MPPRKSVLRKSCVAHIPFGNHFCTRWCRSYTSIYIIEGHARRVLALRGWRLSLDKISRRPYQGFSLGKTPYRAFGKVEYDLNQHPTEHPPIRFGASFDTCTPTLAASLLLYAPTKKYPVGTGTPLILIHIIRVPRLRSSALVVTHA